MAGPWELGAWLLGCLAIITLTGAFLEAADNHRRAVRVAQELDRLRRDK